MKQEDLPNEVEKLEKVITHLEGQRLVLGDDVVDSALKVLQEKLGRLEREVSASRTPGERRVVTVLFCDVAGSTALAEELGPEAWTELMNSAFEYLIEPVRRYGGNVARLMGDAILAFFGAPSAREDDPERAILAGLGIQENIKSFREKLRKERGINFNVRVGINTGLAVVGDVGSEETTEYTAMGDAVNIAARMEHTAQPGTVQIAEPTYKLVAPIFECKVLGGISVKGKSKPVSAYQVLARKTRPGTQRGLEQHGIHSPIVGRERELDSIRGALTRLQEGEGGILIITGEAGIGKSRLFAEIRRNVAQSSQTNFNNLSNSNISTSTLTWLEGHTLSFGENISYWTFQEIFQTFSGINEGDTEDEVWQKLEKQVKNLFGDETADVIPYLASLMSLNPAEEFSERVRYIDAESLRHQIYRACRRFFQRLAEQTPLVMLFDDLHWMDASSAGLLEHLLPLTESAALLICGLSRPDPESPWENLLQRVQESYSRQLIEINLQPLSTDNSNQLLHNLLDIDGLAAHIRQMIVNKADGNPFFLEEIIRDMIVAEALVFNPSTKRWAATQAAKNISVPDTIQGLIMARIDRLEEEYKRVVRWAAVIGRTFPYRVLAAVLEDDDLDEHLTQLQLIELIQEKQRFPELEYTFKHALAQQAAYDSLLLQERRELHARVAAAIEAMLGDRLEEFYGLLAYHYSEAELWNQAQTYLFKAGDQAARIAADSEALAYYSNAMEAYTQVRGDNWDPTERARLERKIGEALYRQGNHDQARPYLVRSLALLGENLPSSKWGTRLAIFRALFTQVKHRLFPHYFVRSMSDPVETLTKEIFLAALALGWVEIALNFERYLLVVLRAINATERGGFAYGSAHLAASIAPAIGFTGLKRFAERYFRLASEYAGQAKPPRPVFQLELGQAVYYNTIANFKKSLKHGLRAVEIAQDTGALREWGSAMLLVTWAHYALGNLVEGRNTGIEMIRVGEEGGDQQVVVWGLNGSGTWRKRLGQIDEAIHSFLRAEKIAKELPNYSDQVTAGAWLGRCYLNKGDLEQALSIFANCQEISLSKGAVAATVYLGNGFIEAYLSGAEKASGEEKQEWLRKAKRVLLITIKDSKRNQSTFPDTLLLQGRYEWLSGKQRAANKWWSRALKLADLTQDRYYEGIIHLEIGKRLEDRQHLRKAESILEGIDAAFDMEAARNALSSLPESNMDY